MQGFRVHREKGLGLIGFRVWGLGSRVAAGFISKLSGLSCVAHR